MIFVVVTHDINRGLIDTEKMKPTLQKLYGLCKLLQDKGLWTGPRIF